MKKITVLCTLCSLLVLLCCACDKSSSKVTVGFINGLNYSMRPNQVAKLLGEPIQVKENRALSPEVFYIYEVELDGVLTQVIVSFLDDKHMLSVVAQADASSSECAKKLFDSWKSKEIAAHKDETGYYCGKLQKSSDTDYQITLGTEQGAVGLTVDISVTGSFVKVYSVYMD